MWYQLLNKGYDQMILADTPELAKEKFECNLDDIEARYFSKNTVVEEVTNKFGATTAGKDIPLRFKTI